MQNDLQELHVLGGLSTVRGLTARVRRYQYTYSFPPTRTRGSVWAMADQGITNPPKVSEVAACSSGTFDGYKAPRRDRTRAWAVEKPADTVR